MTEMNCVTKPRKSLADQIDRLDLILDGLADGLAEAVADAVQAAVKAAVAAALTNPEVLASLRQAQAPCEPKESQPVPVPNGKGWWSSVRDWAKGVWNGVTSYRGATWTWMGQKKSACKERVSAGCSRMVQHCRSGWEKVLPWLQFLWRVRLPLLLALLVALVFGVLGFVSGPWVAAIGFGIGGFALTLQVVLAWAVWTSLPKVESLPWAEANDGNPSGEPVPPTQAG
jgi:hypothetical protein